MVQSIHKTMPALTQTALLHMCRGTDAQKKKTDHFVRLFQTTSPSYVLMYSISRCMAWAQGLCDLGGKRPGAVGWNPEKMAVPMAAGYKNTLFWLREEIRRLPGLSLYEGDGADPGKLVIAPAGGDGPWLYHFLRERGVQPEMQAGTYVILMTSVCDTREDAETLLAALRAASAVRRNEMPPEHMDGDESGGSEPALLAEEYVAIYPPGIPLLCPGERVTPEHLRLLRDARERGLTVTGLFGPLLEQVEKTGRKEETL